MWVAMAVSVAGVSAVGVSCRKGSPWSSAVAHTDRLGSEPQRMVRQAAVCGPCRMASSLCREDWCAHDPPVCLVMLRRQSAYKIVPKYTLWCRNYCALLRADGTFRADHVCHADRRPSHERQSGRPRTPCFMPQDCCSCASYMGCHTQRQQWAPPPSTMHHLQGASAAGNGRMTTGVRGGRAIERGQYVAGLGQPL